MAHGKRCAGAKGKRCRCICKGVLHGGSPQPVLDPTNKLENIDAHYERRWKALRNILERIENVIEELVEERREQSEPECIRLREREITVMGCTIALMDRLEKISLAEEGK